MKYLKENWFTRKPKSVEVKKSPENYNKNLGDKFKLPFGDDIVMNHFATKMVYIDGVWGESSDTFLTAYETITNAIPYGIVVPSQINVICKGNGRVIHGSYAELKAIVNAIKENN